MQAQWYDHVDWKRISLWVVLVVMVGYVVHDQGWKSASAVIVAFFAVVALEFSVFRKSLQNYAERPQVREHDRVLFQKLIELLPSDGVIAFINNQNMAGWSFDPSRIEPIDHFLNGWNNAAHEFVDVDVEHVRQELMNACRNWSRTIAMETFPTRNGRQSVPEEWEIENPERFNRVVDLLHTQAQEIVDRHEQLIRIGTRRLMP